MSDEECERLITIAARVNFEPDQAVFREFDPAKHVFNVTTGAVRLSKALSDGRRQVTGFLYPGDFLGIAYAKTYAYTAEAITPLALCRFQRSQFEILFDEIPALERRVLEATSNEIKAAQDYILLLGRKNAREKLLSFLRGCLERNTVQGLASDTIELPMGRTDIADYLGLSIETVSRTFTRLVNEGILKLPADQTVIVRRPELLRKLAEGE